MKTTTEIITPAIAQEWLIRNVENRVFRTSHSAKCADDMTEKKWTQCIAPLAFFDDGVLADGQHRLEAIVNSGMEQEFIIVRGLTRADAANFDRGMPRTIPDNARISGVDKDISPLLISVCRAIEEGRYGKAGVSDARIMDMVVSRREAAVWAIKNGPSGKFIRRAVVLGAIGRAWLQEEDTERLLRMCEVLSTGICLDKDETSAAAIRNYMVAKGSAASLTGAWRDTFFKIQNAIRFFMTRRELKFIRRVDTEAYPIV